MDTWNLYTALDGNELTVGYHAFEREARVWAQRYANNIGQAVELVQVQLTPCDDYDGEVFEPEIEE